jgi:membrane-associated phospholipid phosphatase
MVFLSSLSIWGWTEDIRYTGLLTFIGLPFVQSGKDIIKRARFKACLRPWHEQFSNEKRSSGGFPSGHTANVVFMTTLWWMRHGPKWGVPLALFSTLVMADFINCNRHYVSQIVAGAGLGVVVACAANKVIERKLSDCCEISCEADEMGKPTLKVGLKF